MIQKKCPICKDNKLADEFSKQSRSSDGLQYACKDCMHKLNRENYLKNKASITIKTKKNNLRRRLRNKLIVYNYLLTNLCVDCGEDDIMVLEFDHVYGTKAGSITAMVASGLSVDKLMNEIKKCEVRCANCHRKKTYFDLGWEKTHQRVNNLLKKYNDGNFSDIELLIGNEFLSQVKKAFKNG